MVDCNVDLLLRYLESFPELGQRFKQSPPRLFWRGRWRIIRRVRKLSSGLEIVCRRGGRIRLLPGNTASYQREQQKERLLALIERHLGSVQREKVLDKTDRNRHQTEAFLRVHLKGEDQSWAVLGVYERESSEMSSRLLSSLVLWWDEIGTANQSVVFLPEQWSERIVELLPYLILPVVCCKYCLGTRGVRQIYPGSGQLSSIQSPYVMYPKVSEAPRLFAQLNREYPSVDLLCRYGKWELSYKGLPVAWFDQGGKSFFDLQAPKRVGGLSSLRAHIQNVMDHRQFPPPVANHFYFRFGEERWLESLILKEHRTVNQEFIEQIYSQVPTWVGGDRKVLDLLTATNQGRLAVIELKTHKDLSLLFQGLDYLERVEHHRRRGDFGPAGYFVGVKLAEVPPLLYLLCPLFEFHRVLSAIRRYLRKDFEVWCIGINTDWKGGLKILRQFQL